MENLPENMLFEFEGEAEVPVPLNSKLLVTEAMKRAKEQQQQAVSVVLVDRGSEHRVVQSRVEAHSLFVWVNLAFPEVMAMMDYTTTTVSLVLNF